MLHKFYICILQGSAVTPGPNPPDLVSKQLSFLLPVILDRAPLGKDYGDVVQQPKDKYSGVGMSSPSFVLV